MPRHKSHVLNVPIEPELGRRILRARLDLLDELPFSSISIPDTIHHLIAAGLESRYAEETRSEVENVGGNVECQRPPSP